METTRIFCYCYDHQQPTGGQKSMYKLVDILNDNGLEAYVLHRQDGFSLSWFAHHTKIMGRNEFKRTHRPARDILVAKLEEATELLLTDPTRLRGRSEAARKTASEYSREREENSYMVFWRDVLRGK